MAEAGQGGREGGDSLLPGHYKPELPLERTMRILVLLALFALAGCSTVKLMDEARHVRLVFSEPLVAKCSFRGDVVGSEGRWFNSWLIPNDTLSYAPLNDLRNHAHELGGDTVLVPGIPNLFRTSVTIIGQAYRCAQ
jgi:hypothetical protein